MIENYMDADLKLPSICLPVTAAVAADDNAETLPNADEFVSADAVNCGNEAAET